MSRLAFASLSLAIGLGLLSPARAQTGTGSVSGRVTFEGQPVPGVAVTLQPSSGGPPRATAQPQTTTDADGRFRLSGVPDGRYSVAPLAPNFVLPRESPFGPAGKSVTLAAGETVEGLDFELTLGGVITGRVTEAGGRPVIEERVNLVRLEEGGRKTPHRDFNLSTDDRGIYRAYGLPAGRYLVSVGRSKEEGMVVMGGPDRRLVQTFHPNTAEESRATIVEVTSGGEADGVDIVVGGKERTFEVSGRVIDAETGQPVPLIRVGYGTLRPGEMRVGAYGYGMTADGRGNFRLSGLTSARYVAFAAPEGDNDQVSDPEAFEVTDHDVGGLEIKVRRGGSISGVAVVDGSRDPEVIAQLTQLQLAASAQSREHAAPRPGAAKINPDGSFQIRGLRPGKVMISVFHPRQQTGLTLLRVERQGVEQRDGIEVGPGEHIAGVRLVIAHGSGIIRGEVKISGDRLPENVRLRILARNLSAPGQGWAEADSRGRFVIEGLISGEYEVTVTPAVVSFDGGGPPRQPARLPEAKQKVAVTSGAETQVSIVLNLGPVEK